MLLDNILVESRLLSVLHDNLENEIKQNGLYADVIDFLERYAQFNKLSTQDVVDAYTRYITLYNKHCKLFGKTGMYPIHAKAEVVEFSRIEYDLVLMMSVLFAPHRFEIMRALSAYAPKSDNSLFIGLGPGLEMHLTRHKHQKLWAYDLSINPFLYTEFADADIKTELYTGQQQDFFDSIYLIEILEHLDTPYHLLNVCYDSLKPGGQVILTTATDIPQFDHLYNFPDNHTEFENKLQQIGFSILHKQKIEHNYLLMQLKPSNHFYIIQKKK